MKNTPTEQAIALIASQIEAASSLLKFAADDLSELMGKESSIFAEDLRSIVRNMQSQAATLDGNVAFLTRLDLIVGVEDGGEDTGGQAAWTAQG